MNIACTACSARYGVADDKLIGKRVRITCKRCGTVLIVDGNTNPPTVSASSSIAPARPSSSHPPVEARSPAPVAEPPFTVLFADGRQEQADIAQIVRFHRSGQLGGDSLVWREGMAEWTNPWDVAEIAAAFRRMGYARPTPVPAPPAVQAPVADAFDDEATQVVESSPQHEPPRYEDGEPPTNVVNPSRLSRPPAAEPRAASRPVAEDDESPTYVARASGSTSATAAAREAQRARRASTQPPREGGHWNEPGQPAPREPAQRAQRVSTPAPAARSSRPPAQARARSTRPVAPREDLFARQSRAGSEEEQEVEAAPEYDFDAPRLTGARNETSVLFSLDSLIKKEPPPALRRTPPPRDESLLVDSGNSLPVGGGFSPALSAPDFTAPVSAPPPPAPSLPSAPYGYDSDAARSSRAWLYVLLVVAVGGAGVVGWRTGVLPSLLVKAGGGVPQPATVAVPPAPSAASSASEHTTTAPSVEAAASSTPSAEASSSAAASASAAPATSASASATTSKATLATTATSRATAVATHVTAAHESSAKESAVKDTASQQSAPKEEAAAPTAAAASNAGPFDTAAAKEALTTTAGNAASCKQADGPTGNGKVSITFAPSGRPTSVAVTGDLAGTTVGSCVARMFRSVKVPPFSGDPVTVAKSFSIE
jgi:predicted Zn finger-like uncharacterized protein